MTDKEKEYQALYHTPYKQKKEINDLDLEIEYRDEGPWRSYILNAEGLGLKEMLESATVTETAEDGVDIDTYGVLEDYVSEFASSYRAQAIRKSLKIIYQLWKDSQE